MSVDLSKVRPGDHVTAAFRVVLTHLHGDPGAKYVVVETGGHMTDIYAADLTGHTPKALAVGDRVHDRHVADGVGATVLFADERHIVIRTDEDGIHSGPVGGTWAANLERTP